MSEVVSQLRGVIPPLATPLTNDWELDYDGLERLVEQLLGGGVHGLFALGTTSEGPSLSYRVRYRLVEYVCELAESRVPVLVGISDTSLSESLELARHAHAAGAAAVVTTPPYYLPISQDQVVAYIERLADASPLPVVLYNIPMCAKVEFQESTIARCRELDNVVGIKDTSCDMPFFQRLTERFAADREFAVLIGPEDKLADALEMGADGGVCGGANLFPRLYVAIYEAAARGDQAQAKRLQAITEQVIEKIYRVGPEFPTSIMQGMKGVLELQGICSRTTAPPIDPLSDEQMSVLQSNLAELAPLLDEAVPAN